MNSSDSEVSPPKLIATKWRPLFVEFFVALSLCVAYCYLVKTFAAGNIDDRTNVWVFSSCSLPGFHLETLGDVWKGRLQGLLLSGWLFDFLVKNNQFQIDQFSWLLGIYQAVWLFLLFLIVILGLSRSLFINLGIFAGLIYNFSPASGLYFYPWDLPATLFFTLAVLFFERRQMWLMVATICAGCFFKETVLVCALLPLFATFWKWEKRILIFAGMITVYVLGKKFLLEFLNFDVAAFSMNNATNWSGLFHTSILATNWRLLFSPTLNHTIFANGGTLVAVLLLGWHRRFLPYMVVIIVFLAGQFMYGGFSEFRIFMQILPLSLIVLTERLLQHEKPGVAGDLTAEATPTWATRKTFRLLIPLTIILIALSASIAVWRYCDIFVNRQPDRQLQFELGADNVKFTNDLASQNQLLRRGYAEAALRLGMISGDDRRFTDAVSYYQRALELDTNSVLALNNLAWLRATASDPILRNGDEAVQLAERACQLTNYKEPFLIGTLAAAYAEAGRFTNAVAEADKARKMALAQGQKQVADTNEQLLELYKSGRAFHQENISGK